jgi:membrane protein DedA with SNARE-associated domain
VTSLATLGGLLVLLIAGGIGFPVPEDVTLVGAGLLARSGDVTLASAIAVGIAGVCTADWIIYLAGRRYGDDVVHHPWIARLLRREHLAAIEALVERRGAWAVFLARFVLGTRLATFLSAGTFGMPPAVFALAEGAGSVIFASAMVTLGYLFAHQAERIAAEVGRTEHWLVLGGLAALALVLVLRAVAGRWFADPRRLP